MTSMQILTEKLAYLREHEDFSILYKRKTPLKKDGQVLHGGYFLKDSQGRWVVFNKALANEHLMWTWQHQYQLGPCLTEAQVGDFERQYHITLPDDYRRFLLEVGHGGAGPGYGLYTLEKGLYYASEEDIPPPDILQLPFPFTEHACKYDRTLSAEENLKITAPVYGGFLPFAYGGCTDYYVLILNGPERGNIWMESYGSDGGIWPLTYEFCGIVGDNRHIGFYEWYNLWLDRQIADLHERIMAMG